MKNFTTSLFLSWVFSAFVLLLISPANGQIDIPATWSYPIGDQDLSAPGFSGAIQQARESSGLTATIARGNSHLGQELIDPLTLQPYLNLAVHTEDAIVIEGGWAGDTPINPDGTFIEEGVINYSASTMGLSLDEGSFTSLISEDYRDRTFPGLPGALDQGSLVYENGSNFSLELLTWLELPAGQIILGIHHDDAVEVAFHPNDARDIFRTQVVGFDSNSGFADRTVTLDVESAGLYPVRVVLAQWTAETALEFYTAPVSDPTTLTLINDSLSGASAMAWRNLISATRPYAATVFPLPNATGVAPATTISATLENLEGAMPEMKVNGATVSYTVSTEGTASTLTHTPADLFTSGESVTVELSYGNTVSSWGFTIQTGRKALLITGAGLTASDGWISTRLAKQFGFDVEVVTDALVTLDDATGTDLIFNSSTVNSNNVAEKDFETLPIPLINVESANADDFRLIDAPYAGKFSNNPTSDTIDITNPGHPLAAGLSGGPEVFLTGAVQFHKAEIPANGIPIASPLDNPAFGVLYGIESGTTVIDSDFTDFSHPARRVYFGLTGNDGSSKYNDSGLALFDAAIRWALATPAGDLVPEITAISRNTDDTVTLTWRSSDDGLTTYTLHNNDHLNTPVEDWPDENDSISTQGEFTTYTTNLSFPTNKQFFAIRRNEG